MSIEAYQLESVIRIPLGWLEKKHAEWVERDTRKQWLKVRSEAIGHAVATHDKGVTARAIIDCAQLYEHYIRNGGPPRDAGT